MRTLLNTLYHALDFQSGALLSASESPTSELSLSDWLEKGEWLAAAKRAGAEKIFFVDNNPVVVFASCGSGDLEKEELFNSIWCLGRPRLLFLAAPGEISVLDLAQEPLDLKHRLGSSRELKTLETITELAKVSELLKSFHRDQIESGRVFGEERFGDINNRADKALIRDIKVVRRELMAAGLNGDKLKYAHALIGRSVFIRYLEDRGIITYEYFARVAEINPEWKELLHGNGGKPDLSDVRSYYARALDSKAFTYAVFRELAQDFNGDMFPDIDDEELAVLQNHLDRIQELLYSDAGVQMKLFFYTYNFNIVPLELISSIYEEFYDSDPDDYANYSKARMDGAYYTPSVLAELTVSRVLTADELCKYPRVMDPSCGSGIFLVESFRRIVRYEHFSHNQRLSFDTLRNILKKQIAGIEVNEEAARITAFSLYLAFLHYLSPPAITEQIAVGNRLPNLLVSGTDSDNHYQCILVGNAFDEEKIANKPFLAERFGENSANIIVSNPPWGDLKKSNDPAIKERQRIMLNWLKKRNKVLGDNESSQAFLWRYLDFLPDGGKASALVSYGVMLKQSTKSQSFREQWMKEVQLREVYNFIHASNFFFENAASPFLMLVLQKGEQRNEPVTYSVIKRSRLLRGFHAIAVSKYDVHYLRDEKLSSKELWKTYYFGGVHDRRFILQMQRRSRLEQYLDHVNSGRGYQLASQKNRADKLHDYKAVKKLADRYTKPILEDPPEFVERYGTTGAYHGRRILVNEGVSGSNSQKGVITAQYHEDPFCFNRSITGLKLTGQSVENYKTLLGVLWSSLARYYFFMTTTNWGVWYYKILVDELMDLPIDFRNDGSEGKIIKAVDKLRNYQPTIKNLLNMDGEFEDKIDETRRIMQDDLDNAVFEYYGMTEEQKDLVRDFCNVTLPFFYKPYDSVSCLPLTEGDLLWLQDNYIMVFIGRWKAYLDDDSKMEAVIHSDNSNSIIAIEFYPVDKTDTSNIHFKRIDSWRSVLDRFSDTSHFCPNASQIIIDGVFHIVSNTAIVILKRNEKRFWTKSLAREDADITLLKYMTTPDTENGGGD